jgi:hypothetical protein
VDQYLITALVIEMQNHCPIVRQKGGSVAHYNIILMQRKLASHINLNSENRY